MAKPGILVCGSLHLDTIVRSDHLPGIGETVLGAGTQRRCGGKGYNQAVAASRHGGDVYMLGCVGGDDDGRLLRDGLDRAGVRLDLLQTDDEADSGMSVAIIDAGGDYGAVVVPGASRQVVVQMERLPAGVELLVLQNEIPQAAGLQAAAAAYDRQVPILLNHAPAQPAAEQLLETADYLVLNQVEAGQLAGRRVDSVDDATGCLDRLRRREGQTVIVTLGGQGLVFCAAAGEAQWQQACAAPVVSTHGAGDMFVGALVSRLVQGQELPEALAYAQSAAADVVAGRAGG